MLIDVLTDIMYVVARKATLSAYYALEITLDAWSK